MENTQWEDNIILVDIDWLDKYVFDLSVNFERMLERPIPKAALDRWVDYVSLDGGLRPGNNKTQVLLISSDTHKPLRNCVPDEILPQLDGKAFKDNLGEFLFSVIPVEDTLVTKGDFFVQSMDALLSSEQVKRLLLVPDVEAYGMEIRNALRNADLKGKEVMLFATEPLTGFHCMQEILTYSVMATLGINSQELKF